MCATGPALATLTRMPESWFPTVEELDAYAARRREERSGWELHWFASPTVDPTSVIVSFLDSD